MLLDRQIDGLVVALGRTHPIRLTTNFPSLEREGPHRVSGEGCAPRRVTPRSFPPPPQPLPSTVVLAESLRVEFCPLSPSPSGLSRHSPAIGGAIGGKRGHRVSEGGEVAPTGYLTFHLRIVPPACPAIVPRSAVGTGGAVGGQTCPDLSG